MGTRPYQTTNELVAKVCADVKELISWAEADAEHAAESDAPDTARDDRARVRMLKRALDYLENCTR